MHILTPRQIYNWLVLNGREPEQPQDIKLVSPKENRYIFEEFILVQKRKGRTTTTFNVKPRK